MLKEVDSVLFGTSPLSSDSLTDNSERFMHPGRERSYERGINVVEPHIDFLPKEHQ